LGTGRQSDYILMVALNICGLSGWNSCLVMFVAPSILGWLPDFRKFVYLAQNHPLKILLDCSIETRVLFKAKSLKHGGGGCDYDHVVITC
jgi:hypothetical protein